MTLQKRGSIATALGLRDLGTLAQTAHPQLVLDVECVLERCTLTRASTVPDSNHQCLVLPAFELADDFGERIGSKLGMFGSAHRQGVAIRAEPGCCREVELRPGRIDEVVVLDPLPFAVSGGQRVDDVDRTACLFTVPIRV